MKLKKLFFVLFAIIAEMHTTSAWATDVAKIGEVGYETFAAALSAVQDGDVIYLLANADASSVAFTPCNGKKVIIAGTTGNEILDMGNGAKGGISGTTEITFYNLKMQIRHTNTTGIWYTENIYHAGKVKYENVVFDGAIATADYVEFLNCTFASNPQNMEYTVWNYGGTQVFKGCTFEIASAGTKSFIKDYAEPAGTLATNLVMAECTFNIPDPTPSGWKGATVYFSTANSSTSNIYLDEETTQAGGSINYSSGCENKAKVCSTLTETGFTLPTPTKLAASVAKIGDVEYASLAEAVAAVPTDGTETTITMIDDESIEGNAGVTIAATQNVVLDLNGKTVKNLVNEDKSSQVITNKGTLTIKDSSTEGTGLLTNAVAEGTNAGEWWGTTQYNYATNVITNTGTLIVESGEIYETAAGSICYAIDNNSSAADAILTVNGGYIHKETGTAVRQFCNSTTKENTINMNGGTIEAGYAGIWIQLPGSSSQAKKLGLNVTGGTLKGEYAFYDYTSGDVFDASQYNISGGTFDGNVFSYGANVAISGGEFNGEVAVKQTNPSTVSVTGGTFASDVYTYGDNASTGFITGGTFLTKTYEYESETYECDWISCLAEGFELAENADGTFGVKESEIAKIGDTIFSSLAAAVAAVPTDGTETTITMIDDANILGNAGVTIAAGQNIVLDLNGKTVKNLVNENKASQLITNKGTLKITGEGTMTNELADGTIAGDWPTYNYATNLITNLGTLTIENGTYENTQDSGITYTLDNNSNGVPATATINGGKFISAGNAAVRMFCNSTTAANTLTINGGYFEGNYYAVSVSNASGATKAGSLTINDGEFESRADEYNACVANWESNKSSNIAVSITGGKFNDYVLIASNANVTGGTYKYNKYTDPDDGTVYDLSSYLAAGFELNENADGTFGVQVSKMMVYTLDNKEGKEMSSSEFIALAETNPNAIAIVGSELEQFAQGMTNVIVSYMVKTGVYYYSCPNFVLDDWHGFYSPVEFVAEAGSYKRTDTAGMNSVCLPFDIDEDDVQGTIGSFVATDLITEDEEGNRVIARTGNIYFNDVPSVMAGTPCIVECASDVTEWDIDLAGRTIVTTPNNAYAMKGQFADSTIGEGYFKVNGDGTSFVNTTSTSVSYTFRAYLDLANTSNMGAEANQFTIRWTDDPTAILNIINEKNAELYFDLTGRKVADPVKGSIYIVNGKKIIY